MKWLFFASLQYLRSLYAYLLIAISRVRPSWITRLTSDANKLDELGELGKPGSQSIKQFDDFGESPEDLELEYRYENLSGSHSIRLLRLLRDPVAASPKGSTGLEKEEYRFNLAEHLLDDLPPYEALSYRWEGQTDSVLIGSHILSVNTTCKAALDHFGKTRPAGSYIWVDAICINQNDVKERNAQVTLMVDIYTRARQTVVWLGEALPDHNFALNLYAGLNSKAFSINNMETDAARAVDNPLHPRKAPDERYSDIMWSIGDTLESLLARSWFTRVWVIQEVALAKEVIVECTNARLPWDMLHSAAVMQAAAQKDDRRTLYDRPLKIMRTRDHFKRSALDIADVLTLSRTYDATDPRDRIYGLLGLNADFAALIGRPDYNKPVAEVWMEAATVFLSKLSMKALYLMTSAIECEQLLGPMEGDERPPAWLAEMDRMNLSNYIRRKPTAANLPSWVPNFEDPPLQWPMDVREIDQTFGSPNHSINGSHLTVRAAIVDTIRAVSGWKKTSGNNRQMWLTWNQWLHESGITFDSENTDAQGLHLRQDGYSQYLLVWRSMFCDLDNQIPDSEELRSWHSWFENELGMNLLMWDSRLMMGRDITNRFIGTYPANVAKLRNSTRHKTLFSTETESKFGLGPKSAKEGDVIVFFAGYNVPFLLRSTPGTSNYLLLGPCFVHGLMNGEQCNWADFRWTDIIIE